MPAGYRSWVWENGVGMLEANRNYRGERMSFRTLEISNAAEIHIKENQLKVTTEEGMVSIPVEDLSMILAHGANIS